MSFYTPFRYPGSKRRLFPFVASLLETNKLWNVQYVEPFAGGASVGLALLYEEFASSIHINDLSKPVYAFWHTALNDPDKLCYRVKNTAVTMEEWHRQRVIYENSETANLPDLGFAAFFLNRANRSGIIGGGVIGGKDQTGEWKVDARFNKEELIHRIQRIGRYRNRIKLYQQDAIDFTTNVVSQMGGNVLTFYDPPYIDKGQALYLDNFDIFDHRQLASQVESLAQPWIATYDYEAAVRNELFAGRRCLSFELSYSAQSRHYGKEAMFLSDRLMLPANWEREGVKVRMSSSKSEHPVFGELEKRKNILR